MKILITGITGTLGTEVCRQLLEKKTVDIVGLSRDEYKQSLFPYRRYVDLHLGDVRNPNSVIKAASYCDATLHLASLKHVDFGERHIDEFVATIITGTQNVLNAQKGLGMDKVVMASTDKAVYPINVYGNCKAIAEKIVLSDVNNVVCRYGNVLNSRGSLLEKLIRLKDGEMFQLTDHSMTRFWITIEDVASLIISLVFGDHTGLCVPELKSSTIGDIINAYSYVTGKSVRVETVGLRPGEKPHEDLIADHEGEAMDSFNASKWSKEDLEDVVRKELDK